MMRLKELIAKMGAGKNGPIRVVRVSIQITNGITSQGYINPDRMVPPTSNWKDTKPRHPTFFNNWIGCRIFTSQVWMYPLIQRERCRIQLATAELASSKVTEFTTPTRYPMAAKRSPRSASSVTLKGSHAP